MAASIRSSFIPAPAEPDMRLEDYLDDKLQSAADLAELETLLASVETQRTQLQTQLDDASRALDVARSTTTDRQDALASQIAGFQALQRSIDGRLNDVASSTAPDDAIRRLEVPMEKLRKTDLAHRYLILLQDVEDLRREARSQLPHNPKAALKPYARLRQLSVYLRELQARADEAAGHLVDHVGRIAGRLWDEMKKIMSDELESVLAKNKWPAIDPQEDMDAEWRACFENTLALQAPEIVVASDVVTLLPIDVMAQMFVKEFRFHFLSDKPTGNVQNVSETGLPLFLDWFLNLIGKWQDFLRDNTGYILAKTFGSTAVKDKMVYLDPACALIMSMLPILRKKVQVVLEDALENPASLSFLLSKLMVFDEEIRVQFAYDGGRSGEWGGLTTEVLDQHFDTWLKVAKSFYLKRYSEIVERPDARTINFDYSGPGKTKPTIGAVEIMGNLLPDVTAQYQGVKRFSHKLRFLTDIQLTILDEYHDRLRGSLEAYYSITSTMGRTLHGVTQEQSKALEGTGALETLCKVFGSADHVVQVLKEWSNDEFFITLWEQLQSRAILSGDGQNEELAGGMTADEIKDRTSASVGTYEDGGVLFDETMSAYNQRKKAAGESLVSALVESHQKAFRPYLQRTHFTTVHEEAGVDLDVITPELGEPLQTLRRNLEFLQRALGTAPFRRVWREALEKLQDSLWSDVLMRQRFTQSGAEQFQRDIQAIGRLIERFLPGTAVGSLSNLFGALRLLTLPLREQEEDGGAAATASSGQPQMLTLQQATDQVFTDNTEAKKLLEALGIDGLTPPNARHILQRRVENTE